MNSVVVGSATVMNYGVLSVNHSIGCRPTKPPTTSNTLAMRQNDTENALGFPERSIEMQPLNVVVRTPDGAISLVVDEVGDVIRLDESKLAPPPDTLIGAQRDLIRGVHQLNDRLLIVLNLTP